MPRWLRRRINDTGRIPLLARLVWPRLHWCGELDDLLTGDEKPGEAPYLCGCVSWPKRYHDAKLSPDNYRPF